MITAVAINITDATTINAVYKLMSGAGLGTIGMRLLNLMTDDISSIISVFLYSSVL